MALMARNVREILAANLRALGRQRRDELGSQPKVAARAKVGQRTVGRAMKGEVAATIDSVERLARACGIEVWQLLHPDLAVSHPAPGAKFTAQEPPQTYNIDRKTVDDLLDTFDKLTATQRRYFIEEMRAKVLENTDAWKHMQSGLRSIPRPMGTPGDLLLPSHEVKEKQ